MDSNTIHSLLLVAVMAIVTLLTRFTPFILFRSSEKTPKVLKYLGKVLPGAVMGMLVIFCFKSTEVLSYPFALPEIIAGGITAGLYLWTKNTLLSIASGTVLYMVLVQAVFV